MSEFKGTPGTWSLVLARMAPDVPMFGYAIKADGRVPYIRKQPELFHEETT